MRILAFDLLLALQGFHVLFLSLHDWIPLGRLNDVAAVRAANPGRKVVIATALTTSFYLFGFAVSVIHCAVPYPQWLFWYLLISYGFLFVGELEAWWVPYFFRPQPERAARYKTMFGSTHFFLPERNGIRINSLHFILHMATVATLVLLVMVRAR